MSSIDDLLKEIEFAETDAKSAEELKFSILKHIFDEYYVKKIKEYINTDLLKKIIRFHQAYSSSTFQKEAKDALKMWFDRSMHSKIPFIGNFVDDLIKLKNGLVCLPEDLSKKILKSITLAIGNTGEFYFGQGITTEFTRNEIMDDELSYLKELVAALKGSSFVNQENFVDFVKENCLKYLGNEYEGKPNKEKWKILEVLKHKGCKTLEEVCEVASLDLPEGYKPIRKLGEGGSGSVYLVENTIDKLEEAVKILTLSSDKGPEDVRRAIESELQVRRLNKMRCPYITMYYSVTYRNGKYLILMEPYEKTLEERMDEVKSRLSFSEAIKYYTQLSRTLGVCHRLGIVHKDLAPHNIGIDSEGDIKLSDFGDPLTTIDKRTKQPPLDYSSPRLLALPEGTLEVLPADNIFALGVMFYEMLTGELPFSDPNIPRENRKQRKEYILKKQQEMKEKGVDALLKNISIDEKEVDEYINAQYDPRVQWEYGINLHSLENNLKYAIEKLLKGEDLIKISLIEI